MSENTKILANVAIIRPILVLLLVFYHAFAIYNVDAWLPIKGFPEIRAYWWLDKLSYAFMLEAFVFVSGYVFGFQVWTKGEQKLKAGTLFKGKFKRLMVPSMVFGLLYVLLFGNIKPAIIRLDTMYSIVSGVAHMWFLPMLFLCFAALWIIEKLRLKPAVVIGVLAIISSVVPTDLPFQMGTTAYYLLFFYLGYSLQRNGLSFYRLYTPKFVALSVVLFVCLFPSLTLLRENISESMGGDNHVVMIIAAVFRRICKIIISISGIVMLFSTVGYYIKIKDHRLPQWVLTIGNLSMGVYLMQQFILVALYRYSNMPNIAGPYILPWLGLVIALVGSLLISFILNKFKIGRLIIG